MKSKNGKHEKMKKMSTESLKVLVEYLQRVIRERRYNLSDLGLYYDAIRELKRRGCDVSSWKEV